MFNGRIASSCGIFCQAGAQNTLMFILKHQRFGQSSAFSEAIAHGDFACRLFTASGDLNPD
ncbi:hypothetical protein EpCFBP13511_20555 [Erwinia persicina]|uniref:Uncharacterized protein n=1 Tax=Erwinia persicina TaxID=55211 RepID=A0A4U3EYI2_9GAMM|nr:hypothetical protein EpCFBP13511_20555 [Erwinia persicina]